MQQTTKEKVSIIQKLEQPTTEQLRHKTNKDKQLLPVYEDRKYRVYRDSIENNNQQQYRGSREEN